MLTVLFWNFNSQARDQESIVTRVVRRHGVDFLVLDEATTIHEKLLAELREVDPAFRKMPTPSTEFQVFTRFPSSELEPYGSDERLEMWRLRRGTMDILLGAIHFHAANHVELIDRPSEFLAHRTTLLEAEHQAGHHRTVLFGDMNMDPFDPGMINAKTGVGALPSRTLTRLRSRDGTPGSLRFYNPMASRLGVEPSEGQEGSQSYCLGAPGTYYFPNQDETRNLFWRHYDQVLIRPDLLDSFADEEFQILTHVPGPDGELRELIRCTGNHWKMNDCDHLPILFTLRPPGVPSHE